ncbi:MAG: hypothetical protein ABEJ97_01710 [Halobellus sp.]
MSDRDGDERAESIDPTDVADEGPAGADAGRAGGIGHHFLRFVSVVLVVDALGLGAWWLLPAGAPLRTGVLVGTLVVAPLLGFLLVYAPEATRAR